MERNILINWQRTVEEAVKRRKEQKLSQERFAELAGVSKPTLSNFEQGKTTLSVENALKILHMLGMVEK